MFDRFTDRARKVMGLARQEAQRWNHEYIGTEHILIGMLKEGRGLAATVLNNRNVDLVAMRSEIEKYLKKGPVDVGTRHLPFTARATKALELSLAEADGLGHPSIGTEHLLLGLLREHDGIAAQSLTTFGVTLEKAREVVLELLNDDSSAIPPLPALPLGELPHGRYRVSPTVSFDPSTPQSIDPLTPDRLPSAPRDRGLRTSMRVGAIYDVVLAVLMLTALPMLSRLLAIPMPPDPLFVRFNALLLLGVALFYWLGAAAPFCLRFAAGTIAFRAGGGIFVALQVPLAHAPLAFLLVGGADLAFAAWHWAELRFRVRARFWPLLLRGDVLELRSSTK